MNRRFAHSVATALALALTAAVGASAQGPPDILWKQGVFGANYIVTYSADGQFMTTATALDVRVRRASDGSILHTIPCRVSGTRDAVVSADGATVYTYDGGGPVLAAWEAATGTQLWSYTVDLTRGSWLELDPYAVSPDGRWMSVVRGSWYVDIWDLQNGATFAGEWTVGWLGASPSVFSPDSRLVYTGDGFRNVPDLSLAYSMANPPLTYDVLSFSPDGSEYVVGAEWGDHKYYRARLADGAILATYPASQESSGLGAQVARYSADGALLYLGWNDSSQSSLDIWDVGTGQLLRTIVAPHGGMYTRAAALSADNRLYTVSLGNLGGAPSSIDRYDTNSGQLVDRIVGHGTGMYGLAWSPDGLLVASAGGDSIVLREASTGRPVSSIPTGGTPGAVAFSPDGNLIAAPVSGPTCVWSKDGTLIRQVSAGWPYSAVDVAFSPAEPLLAVIEGSAWSGWQLSLYDLGGTLVRSMPGWGNSGYVAFSPDGSLVAASDFYGATVWRVDTGEKVASFSSHFGPVAFSKDGRWLAIGSGSTILMVRTADWSQTAVLTGSTNTVSSLAFSPNSDVLTSAETRWGVVGDPAMRFWRVPDGALLGYFDKETSPGALVSFGPDPRYFAFAEWNDEVAVARNPFAAKDTTPPTITASPSPGPNTFGWNSTDVTVTLTATDEAGGSGLDHITYSASGAQTIPDTAVPASTTTVLINVEGVTTLTFTATDKAGNTSHPQSLTIKLDKTAPSTSLLFSPDPASVTTVDWGGGWPFYWYNTEVVVTQVADDGQIGSGLDPDQVTWAWNHQSTTYRQRQSDGPVTLTEEGSYWFYADAYDRAGNHGNYVSPQCPGVIIDKTAPAITGAADRAPNAAGWYNAPVTVSFTATDNSTAMGGTLTVTPSTTLTREGANQSVTGTATDIAGNSASTAVGGLNIDTTPPATTASITGPQAASGDYTGPISVSLSATDNLSGVHATTYSLDGKPQQAYGGPIGVSAAGSHTLTFFSSDNAGNTEAVQTLRLTIALDSTPPVIGGASANPGTLWPPNHKMVDVTVSYTCSDNVTPAEQLVCSLGVTSSEPDNGLGDGDTPNDIEVIDAHHIRLRAERSGKGSGRTYTITITCTDAAGNIATQQMSVRVPKSQGK